jgi:putative DNA primase/helicase
LEDERDRKKLADWAKSSESASKINNIVSLVKSESSIFIRHDELDRDPWLLNCNNGTLDLRTGQLREHRREDLITKLAPVDFDPIATAPTFEAFLRDILPSEPVRRFVQRVIGYALNGTTEEHKLPIFYGCGANGKGTLLNVILDVVGDYGMQAANELLMARQNSHPTDQADLFGKRFVTNQETEEGQRLNESLVKQMTGGDRIRARRMREDFWQFEPTHTLFLATNHKPIIRGTDNAIWRRLRLVPFTVEIPEDKQDRKLPARLREELPGILAWAVRGHMDWLRNGLGEPEEVKAATSAYRSEMDMLKDFIEDRCVVNADMRVVAGELYEAYESWCVTNGERELSQTVFGKKLTERGIDPLKSNGVRYRIGIGLRHEGERPCLRIGEYEIFSDGTLSKDGIKVEAPTSDEMEGRVAGSGVDSSIAQENTELREGILENQTLPDTRPCAYGLTEKQLESA